MLRRALTTRLTPSLGSNSILSRPVMIFLPVMLLTLQSSVGMLHGYSFPFCSGIGMGRHLFHISTSDGGRSQTSRGTAGGGFFWTPVLNVFTKAKSLSWWLNQAKVREQNLVWYGTVCYAMHIEVHKVYYSMAQYGTLKYAMSLSRWLYYVRYGMV